MLFSPTWASSTRPLTDTAHYYIGTPGQRTSFSPRDNMSAQSEGDEGTQEDSTSRPSNQVKDNEDVVVAFEMSPDKEHQKENGTDDAIEDSKAQEAEQPESEAPPGKMLELKEESSTDVVDESPEERHKEHEGEGGWEQYGWQSHSWDDRQDRWHWSSSEDYYASKPPPRRRQDYRDRDDSRRRPVDPWSGCDGLNEAANPDEFHKGCLYIFRPDRRYGFIKCDTIDEDVFFDAGAIKGDWPKACSSSDKGSSRNVEFRVSLRAPRPTATEVWILSEQRRFRGRIRWFENGRGYIGCDGFDKDIYVEQSSFQQEFAKACDKLTFSGSDFDPPEGQLLEFSVIDESATYCEASDVAIIGDALNRQDEAKSSSASTSARHKNTERHKGRIKVFSADQGYGFITSPNFEENLYFRQEAFVTGKPEKCIGGPKDAPPTGQEVEFTHEVHKGRQRACKIVVIGDALPESEIMQAEGKQSWQLEVFKGRIRAFWPDKGYGFISCDKLDSSDVFVHGDSFLDGNQPQPLGGNANDPPKGEEVEFSYDNRGNGTKARAKNVKIVGPAISVRSGGWSNSPSGFELELERVLVELLGKRNSSIQLNESGYAVLSDVLDNAGIRRVSQQLVSAGQATNALDAVRKLAGTAEGRDGEKRFDLWVSGHDEDSSKMWIALNDDSTYLSSIADKSSSQESDNRWKSYSKPDVRESMRDIEEVESAFAPLKPEKEKASKKSEAAPEWYLGQVEIGEATKSVDEDISQRIKAREQWFKPAPKEEAKPKRNPWAAKGDDPWANADPWANNDPWAAKGDTEQARSATADCSRLHDDEESDEESDEKDEDDVEDDRPKRIATEAFSPEGDGELSLSIGQVVTITHDAAAESEDAHRWIFGVNEATKQEGWFPLHFTEPFEVEPKQRPASNKKRSQRSSQPESGSSLLVVDKILEVIRLLPSDVPRPVKEYLETWAREEAMRS